VSKSTWIAIDVDGVLADHVRHILPILRSDYGLELNFSQVRTWDFPVGHTTFGKVLRTAQKEPTFVLTTPVVSGAREAMHKLSSVFHLAIVTARPPEATEATLRWLRENDFPFDDFANRSEGLKHHTVNPSAILIDDYKINILEYLHNTQGQAILFSQPWNEDHSDLQFYLAAKRLRAASDWQTVLNLIPSLT
jgi:5'(3')-deoxyribonucleotidase